MPCPALALAAMAPFAMVSMAGLAAQSFIPGKGPLDCLVSHIIDPYHTTTFVQMMDAAYVGNQLARGLQAGAGRALIL